MRILQVIHGYPPAYNAGSEIYTRTICLGLLRAGHKVDVFTREEDQFRTDYEMRERRDSDEPDIRLHLINMPRSKDRYRHESVDSAFSDVVRAFEPDVVHVGHLNHLSTSIVDVANRLGLPVVFTLHDFWLMCPRGQFLQHSLGGTEAWPLCDGQEDRKCATQCYSRSWGGGPSDATADEEFWEGWVHRRMTHIRRISSKVDMFIAPSQTVLRKFRDEFGIGEDRLYYLDYGFDRSRLRGRNRFLEDSFTFGYIGTHTPSKGIQVLLDAFPSVTGRPRLRIWGRSRSETTPALKMKGEGLPAEVSGRVEWMGEYGTGTIVQDVFNWIDALVVPSIWLENSPLVIHEAQQARVPVITADLGGMAEYVNHEVNGLLFRPRDPASLAMQMQQFVNDPVHAARLGRRGYLLDEDGNVPSIEEHVTRLVDCYTKASARLAS